MPPAIDLAGREFGLLTALRQCSKPERSKRKQGAAWWLCRCACGGETIRSAQALLHHGEGVTLRCSRSCPLRKRRGRDLSGQRFGQWTAEAELPGEGGQRMWAIRCGCGAGRKASARALRAGLPGCPARCRALFCRACRAPFRAAGESLRLFCSDTCAECGQRGFCPGCGGPPSLASPDGCCAHRCYWHVYMARRAGEVYGRRKGAAPLPPPRQCKGGCGSDAPPGRQRCDACKAKAREGRMERVRAYRAARTKPEPACKDCKAPLPRPPAGVRGPSFCPACAAARKGVGFGPLACAGCGKPMERRKGRGNQRKRCEGCKVAGRKEG